MSDPILKEALRLRKLGMAIHWLHDKEKRPVGNGWAKRAVASTLELKAEYQKGRNVGLRTGHEFGNTGYYLNVIDVDVLNQEASELVYQHLYELFPNADELPCVASGSGGESRHFYFLTDEPLRSKAVIQSKEKLRYTDPKTGKPKGKHLWEIAVKSAGTQVVLPPSIHPNGGTYTWETPFDVDLQMLKAGIGPIVEMEDIPEVCLGESSNRVVLNERGDSDDDDLDYLAKVVSKPPLGKSLEDIQAILDALPFEIWGEQYDSWVESGMAVHHETNGSSEGFHIWDEWSQQSDAYEAKAAREKWKSFDAIDLSRDREPVTIRTLLKVIHEEGLAYNRAMRIIDSATNYKAAMGEICRIELDDIETNDVVERLQKMISDQGMPATKGVVSKMFRTMVKEHRETSSEQGKTSVERWLATEVLRQKFDDGRHLIFHNKAFWLYQGGVWRVLSDDSIVGSQIVEVIGMIESGVDDDTRQLLLALKRSGRGDSTNSLANAIADLLRKMQVRVDEPDPFNLTSNANPSYMNCRNLVVWFEKGRVKLKDHRASDRMLTQLQVDYDDDAECPLWDASMAKFMSAFDDGDEVLRHLYEVMGYLIQSSRTMTGWVLMHGKGQNGKSMIFEVVSAILGDAARGKSMADTKNRNSHDEAGLLGKLVQIDDDFRTGGLLPDDLLKKLAEKKMMTANPKGRPEFNFVCRAVPVLLSNGWPTTSDLSDGMARRALVFDMKMRLSDDEKDDSIKPNIIENELNGILHHCIDGWARLQARGRFLVPASCQEAKDTWLDNRNPTARFMAEQLTATGKEEDALATTTLWNAFRSWADEENAGHKLHRNTFYEAVRNLKGVSEVRRMDGNYFIGLTLNSDFSGFDDESDESDQGGEDEGGDDYASRYV